MKDIQKINSKSLLDSFQKYELAFDQSRIDYKRSKFLAIFIKVALLMKSIHKNKWHNLSVIWEKNPEIMPA